MVGDYKSVESASIRVGGNLFAESIDGMTKEFELIPNKLKHPGKHLSISLPIGEKIDDELWPHIVKDVLVEAGYHYNQWVCYRHTDAKHDHVHVVINRKDYRGKTTSDSHEKHKFMEAMRKMERHYVLKPGISYGKKDELKQTRGEFRLAEQGFVTDKMELHSKIKIAISKADDWLDFSKKLEEQGVEWTPRKNDLGKETGARFHYKDKTYSGSKVGYSIIKLEKLFFDKEREQEHKLQKQKQTKRITLEEFIDRCYASKKHQDLIKWIDQAPINEGGQKLISQSYDYIKKKNLNLNNDEHTQMIEKAYNNFNSKVESAKKEEERQTYIYQARQVMADTLFTPSREKDKRGYLREGYEDLKAFDNELAKEYIGLLLGLDKQGRRLNFVTNRVANMHQMQFHMDLTKEDYKRDVEPIWQKSLALNTNESREGRHPKERIPEDPKVIESYLIGLSKSSYAMTEKSVRGILECFEEEAIKQIDTSKFNQEEAKVINTAINEKEFTRQDAINYIREKNSEQDKGINR